MILQYQGIRGESYIEADFISFLEIDLSGTEKEIDKITKEISIQYGRDDMNISDMDNLAGSGCIKNSKKVKIATLSDMKERSNNSILLFSENTKLYLLNSNGKTIKKF